jgi:hypothetical protein
MLRNINDIKNYAIDASDGSVGKVKDFLFDDLAWVIRYFVVDTGTWLASRKVLISPISVQKPNWGDRTLPVSLSKEQVENSPDIDTDKPVSRQHEIDYMGYYGYPYYWGGVGLWGPGMYPFSLYPSHDGFPYATQERQLLGPAEKNAKLEADRKMDPNLRSCHAVVGYIIHSLDGDIGHVTGLLVEDSTWAVRYLVVNTSNWFGGHNVLISPEWIDDVQWLDRSVSVSLSHQAIKSAPEYHAIGKEQQKTLLRFECHTVS